MNPNLPNARSSRSPREREQIQRLVIDRQLCGLANDTKWNELIDAMRQRTDWRPSYRFKCVDGPPSGWDVEWFYHLPFPMISVEWFDIGFVQIVPEGQLRAIRTIDHSSRFEELLARIGLDFERGKDFVRIYGYSPRNRDLFDE